MTGQTAAIEHMAFDSKDWPAADRLARYAAFNGAPTRVSADGPAFSMRVARWRLHRTVLHERHGTDVAHDRGAAEIRDGLDHLLIHHVVAGGYDSDVGSGYRAVPAGHLLLVDMRRPIRTRSRDAHVLTVSLSREAAAAVLGDLGAAHGRVLGGTGIQPLADFLASLTRHAAAMPHAAAPALAQAIAPLLAAAIEEPVAGADDVVREASFDRARRVIENRLADPALGTEMLMEHSRLSRATLYRLFQPHGGLMAFITARRLEQARTRLADRSDPRPIAAIAADCGFPSESHFSRRFAAAYGLRPSAYRDQLLAAAAGAPDPRLPMWLGELR
ncbi:helix-turn-helix transcriptional regulator [Sphingoaurantiacus capsulatus]|uniref:Helix-turn-helix transcriptional regulator n=1 Tax=Sphingoaurantiacus capsulatus TaxID=1771310 RepID=A0ABV7X7A4_9SPHN